MMLSRIMRIASAINNNPKMLALHRYTPLFNNRALILKSHSLFWFSNDKQTSSKINHNSINKNKQKMYILSQFPYPSG
jgi:hypothetical protein